MSLIIRRRSVICGTQLHMTLLDHRGLLLSSLSQCVPPSLVLYILKIYIKYMVFGPYKTKERWFISMNDY